tara:strand:- start:1707 stop:2531 length:825 start_codon:yes stop_codon:yes gene_type:complete
MISLLLSLIFTISFGWRFIPPPTKRNRPIIKVDTSKDFQFNGKPFISIKPYGVAGFYNLGTCYYLSNNYDLSKFQFIGQCSSSWNALFATFNKNHTQFHHRIIDYPNYDNLSSISSLNYYLRDLLLSEYSSEDFNLDRLHVCIGQNPTKIISNFLSLEHAIDCCILSCQSVLSDSDYYFKLYQSGVSLDDELLFFPPKNIYTHYLISPERNYRLNETMMLEIVNKKINRSIIKRLYTSGCHDCQYQKQYLDQLFEENKYNKEQNPIDFGVPGQF